MGKQHDQVPSGAASLHKVVLRYHAVSSEAQTFAGQLGGDMARLINKVEAVDLVGAVREWLVGSARAHHVVNIYDNTDDRAGRGEVVVVLDDRDTALMMKLAVT